MGEVESLSGEILSMKIDCSVCFFPAKAFAVMDEVCKEE